MPSRSAPQFVTYSVERSWSYYATQASPRRCWGHDRHAAETEMARRTRQLAAETDAGDSDSEAKHELDYILNERKVPTSSLSETAAAATTGEEGGGATAVGTATAAAAPGGRQGKKRSRTCRADGCDNYIVVNGLCCRHGGGKKCSVDGCDTSAKHQGLCWKHGGSVECKVEGCTKKAKAKGRCWAHGGGTICSQDGCSKVAVSNGCCWAHGGGKRCLYDGCQRPAYERTHHFCTKHYEEMQHVDYFEV